MAASRDKRRSRRGGQRSLPGHRGPAAGGVRAGHPQGRVRSRLTGAALTIDGTDRSLKERVAALKNARDRAVEAAEHARKSSALPVQVDPVAIDRFTRLMREQLVSGDVAAR